MLREYLEREWDGLLAGIVIAMMTGSLIGIRNGTKGAGILTSMGSGGLSAAALYPALDNYHLHVGYVAAFGALCGGAGPALVGLLAVIGTTIERRQQRIADSLVDRVAPGTDDKGGRTP